MNQFRSKQFIKLKHVIQSCTDSGHAQSARQMLENAYTILTGDEIVILQEYLLSKWDEINPVDEAFKAEMRYKETTNQLSA